MLMKYLLKANRVFRRCPILTFVSSASLAVEYPLNATPLYIFDEEVAPFRYIL